MSEYDMSALDWDEDEQRMHEAEIEALMMEQDPRALSLSTEELYPSEFVEFAIKLSIAGGSSDFSFEKRQYLRDIYDISARRVLLKCGRQVEKCGIEVEKVLTPTGKYITFGDMKVGDKVASLGVRSEWAERFAVPTGLCWPVDTNWRMETDLVVATKKVGQTACTRVKTRMGSELVLSSKTPILTSHGWKVVGDLVVGERVASARRLGSSACYGIGGIGVEMAELCGILVADGVLSNSSVTITKIDDKMQAHIVGLLKSVGNSYEEDKKSKPFLRIHSGPVVKVLKRFGLKGKKSGDKFIPNWFFDEASFDETVAFVKGLWSCGGSIKRSGKTKWEIVYASISKTLAAQVRGILIKLGVPSRLRPNNHAAYRDNLDKDRYLVRVETIEGVRRFLELYGHIVPDDVPTLGDSNRDTYPKKLIQNLIKDVCGELGLGKREGTSVTSVLKSEGLRLTLKYSPSRAKLHRYVDLFARLGADSDSYHRLLHVLHGDVLWDSVVLVEDAGTQDVIHIETKKNHNFIHDNVVTHNSTLLGNLSLAYSALNPSFKTLYVSATSQQAQVFSADRIKEPIETSPLLSALTNRILSQNVFFKQFTNRSQIRLRYAFLSADRVRGIPADKILIDEVQDIMTENIPVIEECVSHSMFKIMRYAGTPKSLDNTIEVYWQAFSTQNEWLVPCDYCNNWNNLGEKNIGKKGVICAKCGKPLHTRHERAQWASMQPRTPYNEERVAFEGFRIPQLMVPWIAESEEGWKDLILKFEQYPRAKFYNEVLGLSFDLGTRPLKRDQIKACCREAIRMSDLDEWVTRAGNVTFAGLDWGCHDDKTRILTRSGFKLFKDIGPEDKVAQFDKETREMTFVKPSIVTTRQWDQPMYHVTSDGVDMMLTGTHRMLHSAADNFEWEVCSMEELSDKLDVRVVGYIDWGGIELESFTIPRENLPDLEFDGDTWLKYLGCFFNQVDMLDADIKKWVRDNVGINPKEYRVPREYLNVSKRQLWILFDAMVFNLGSKSVRGGGWFYSESPGICEDFQEICIRLGLRSQCWYQEVNGESVACKVSWLAWGDIRLTNGGTSKIRRVPYNGLVYCCSVPSGFIVTERNGCIAYQGNTGEASSFTVLTLGGYIDGMFTIFFAHRFTGKELEPPVQLDLIFKLVHRAKVKLIGADYGGGFDRNDSMTRNFGRQKVWKYQYAGRPNQKLLWQPKLGRFIVHRTEVMSDCFNAIKRKQMRFPKWEEFKSPFAEDMLNIFSEHNEFLNMTQYKLSKGKSDDTMHSILYCFLASMMMIPRPDILIPSKAGDVVMPD